MLTLDNLLYQYSNLKILLKRYKISTIDEFVSAYIKIDELSCKAEAQNLYNDIVKLKYNPSRNYYKALRASIDECYYIRQLPASYMFTGPLSHYQNDITISSFKSNYKNPTYHLTGLGPKKIKALGQSLSFYNDYISQVLIEENIQTVNSFLDKYTKESFARKKSFIENNSLCIYSTLFSLSSTFVFGEIGPGRKRMILDGMNNTRTKLSILNSLLATYLTNNEFQLMHQAENIEPIMKKFVIKEAIPSDSNTVKQI